TRARPARRGGAPSPVTHDKTASIVSINWTSVQPKIADITKVHDELKGLSTGNLQVEFTGNAFQVLSQQQGGLPPELLGMIAALFILAIVFRTFGATVLPLVAAIAAMGSGLALIGLLSHL